LTDHGAFKAEVAGIEWPMTRCIQDETTEAEVSLKILIFLLETTGRIVL
jgi:hypothetical protein